MKDWECKLLKGVASKANLYCFSSKVFYQSTLGSAHFCKDVRTFRNNTLKLE